MTLSAEPPTRGDKILLHGPDGTPIEVDGIAVYEAAEQTLRQVFANADSVDEMSFHLTKGCDSQGAASPLVAATTLLALLPLIRDMALRLKVATKSDASLGDVILNQGGAR